MAFTKSTQGKDVLFQETVTIAAPGSAAAAYIQTSVDGLTTGDVVTAGSGAYPNWVNAATLDYDLANTLNATGTLQADLTNVYAPHMRVWLFTDGADIGDACSVKVSIAIAAEDNLAVADIGGLGPDPS